MTSKSCEPITELLVPYADGELSGTDAQRVATHLAGCPDCRAEVHLLQRSLELARAVWTESAAAACEPGARRRRPLGRPVRAVVCASACVMILWLTAGQWLLSGDQQTREVVPGPKVDQANAAPPAERANDAVRENEEIDIETLIAREGQSAKLAASARLLATQPGLKPYRDQAERYLAQTYRGTAAAGRAARSTVSP